MKTSSDGNKPFSVLKVASQWLHWKTCSVGSMPNTGFLAHELEEDEITDAVDEDEHVAADTGAAVLAMAAWFWAARSQFFSLSAGKRRGGDEGGGEGAEEVGREWDAPGGPRVQVNPTLVTPLLVERLRVAVPPRARANCSEQQDKIKISFGTRKTGKRQKGKPWKSHF